MRIFLVLLIMLMNAPCLATDLSNSVVTIRVISQAFDYDKPWQKKHVDKTVLSGCVIENGKRTMPKSASKGRNGWKSDDSC